MSLQQFEVLALSLKALFGVLGMLLAFSARAWFVMRRIDRRTLLLSLEHEALMEDHMRRNPEYIRPAEALLKARKLGL